MECANHVCKCYRGALEKLVKTNSSYKGSGGLTVKMRKRLVSAARCAIRMRSKEKNRVQALALLSYIKIKGRTVARLELLNQTTDLWQRPTASLIKTANE